MSLVTKADKNSATVLEFHGRIDSTNAADLEKEAMALLGDTPKTAEVVVDADDLQYISSAGLRVILKLRKQYPELKIVNVSAEVYEVFDMTGFTEMLPVQKAYRRLNVEGCEVIGVGANGKVYRYDRDTIIKEYFNPDSLPDIQRERDLARRAFVLGVPTAIPFDIVRIGQGYGSVFELLDCDHLAGMLKKDPTRVQEAIDLSVDLLKTIHGTTVRPEDMPDQKTIVLGWADFLKDYLPGEKWQKLHNLIEAVPESHQMNHGDYHIKNVMLQNGEALLIDMDTLCQGDPVFEFGSIFNAYIGFVADKHLPDDSPEVGFLGTPHWMNVQIWEGIKRQYFETEDPVRLQEVEDKSALIGYTRLMRRLIRRNGLDTEEGRATIAFYKEQILSILDRIDVLTF